MEAESRMQVRDLVIQSLGGVEEEMGAALWGAWLWVDSSISPSPLIIIGATGSVSISVQLLLRPAEFQCCVEMAPWPQHSAVFPFLLLELEVAGLGAQKGLSISPYLIVCIALWLAALSGKWNWHWEVLALFFPIVLEVVTSYSAYYFLWSVFGISNGHIFSRN